MFKINYLFVCVAALLAIANVSMAAGNVYTSVADGPWGTGSTWGGSVPNVADIPVVWNGNTVTVDAATYNQATTYVQGAANLIVASTGALNSETLYAGWTGDGTITVNGGSITNGGSSGYGIGLAWSAGTTGTLIVNSGTISTYKLDVGNGGTGIVKLYGGTLTTTRPSDDQVSFGGTGSYMDMKNPGTLILNGNRKGYVDSLINTGKIFSSAPNSAPVSTYESANDRTVVVVNPGFVDTRVLVFGDGAGTGLWRTVGNWLDYNNQGGAPVGFVPTSGNPLLIGNNKTCTIDASTSAVANNSYMQNGGKLIMNGGTLDATRLAPGYSGTGEFVLNSGTVVLPPNTSSNNETCIIGFSSGSSGIITVNGGSITTYNLEIGIYSGSSGSLKIYGGTVMTTRPYEDQIQIGTSSAVDMRNPGTFVLTGDMKGRVEYLIDEGRIYTSDARGALSVVYDSNTGLTTVSVVTTPAPDCAELKSAGLTNPVDLNQDCYVNINDLLIFVSRWQNTNLN